MPASFLDRLAAIQQQKRSLLCVGLDPDLARLPSFLRDEAGDARAVLRFNAAVIEATAPLACAFKLNLAFYESLGREGPRVLEETLARIPDGVLTIADGKRSDIGNSARFYADATFERYRFEACTVSPYMGADAVRPFLEHAGKAVFVLARTTNPGAAAVQELDVEGKPLFLHVARLARHWGAEAPGTPGLVAGASDAGALKRLRAACPALPLLVPGVGAQGGAADAVRDAAGSGPVLVNSSRSILYAYEADGASEENFAEASAEAAEALRAALGPPA